MIERLIARMENPKHPSTELVLKPELVARDSVRSLARVAARKT